MADALKLAAFTWNVGNAKPDADELHHWLPEHGEGYDIIAIGVQECKFGRKSRRGSSLAGSHDDMRETSHIDRDAIAEQEAPPAIGRDQRRRKSAPARRMSFTTMRLSHGRGRSTTLTELSAYIFGGSDGAPRKSKHEWDRMITARLGNAFVVCAHVALWEMRLTVYCRRTLRPSVSGIATASSATGVGGVMGNKGGLVARLKVGPTTIAFCSCHLEAHEGAAHLQARNDDCREVLRETMGGRIGGSGRPLDVAHAVDHLIWMGDLNYRIDLGAEHPSRAATATTAAGAAGGGGHSAHVQAVADLVEAAEWEALLGADQLRAAAAAGDAFVGFDEGRIAFAPTFKVLRQPGVAYLHQRTPSYCDRILWKSMPSCRGRLVQESLRPVPEVSTSDHKPLLSTFTLHPSANLRCFFSTQTTIEVRDLVVRDIMPSDITGTSDPFCMFFTHPAGLLTTSRAPKTTVKKAVQPGRSARAVGEAAQIGKITRQLTRMLTGALTGKTESVASWKDSEVPTLQLAVTLDSLENACLVVGLFDYDRWSASDPLGVVTIPLARPRETTHQADAPGSDGGDAMRAASAAAATTLTSYEIKVDEPLVLGHSTAHTGRLACTLRVTGTTPTQVSFKRFGSFFRRQSTSRSIEILGASATGANGAAKSGRTKLMGLLHTSRVRLNSPPPTPQPATRAPASGFSTTRAEPAEEGV